MNLCDSLSLEVGLRSSTAHRRPCAADEARPGPHDLEKAPRRSRARANDRGAVSRELGGGQHGAWQLLYAAGKGEREFHIFMAVPQYCSGLVAATHRSVCAQVPVRSVRSTTGPKTTRCPLWRCPLSLPRRWRLSKGCKATKVATDYRCRLAP